MPYDFVLRRKDILENATALNINKNIADELIKVEPRLHDLNDLNSRYHYKNKQIENLNKEYPEMHFQLFAEINDLYFLFNFWKDEICLELGRVENVEGLFTQIKFFSVEIIGKGFLIEDPIDDKVWDLENGIEFNKREYLKWCGLVDKVENSIRKKE